MPGSGRGADGMKYWQKSPNLAAIAVAAVLIFLAVPDAVECFYVDDGEDFPKATRSCEVRTLRRSRFDSLAAARMVVQRQQ